MKAMKLIAKDELLKLSELSESALEACESRGLLQSSGVADDTIPLYDGNALRRAGHLKSLLDMGYGFDQLQRISADIGFPGATERTSTTRGKRAFLTIGELGRRTKLNARTIKYWEERGIIKPESRSDGGYRLYSLHDVLFCKLVRDLQNFGYPLDEIKEVSDLFRIFYQLKSDIRALPAPEARDWLRTMLEKIDQLFAHTAQLREGIERWEKLLNQQQTRVHMMQAEVADFLTESSGESTLQDMDSPKPKLALAGTYPEDGSGTSSD
jgi:DNA-binding transcriptional MerR regulator